jgi:3',5'-cyclic AMP phosphodiesterase CpdA
MEPKLKPIAGLILALTFTTTSCEKEDLILIATESANDRFCQSEECNCKNPFCEIIVPSEDYQILSMADSHVEKTNTKNLDQFFRAAKSIHPAAVIMDGDLTNGRSDQYDVFVKHLPIQDSLSIFFVAGNHDVYFNGWKEFYSRFGTSTYRFSIKTPVAKDLFVCLESGGGTLGDKQISWLTNTLQTCRSEYRYCFVITHNNLFRAHHTPSTNPMTDELGVLIDLFTKYRVNMVITGHDHKRDDSLFGITRYIQLDALQDGKSNASYFKIHVRENSLDYTFENI